MLIFFLNQKHFRLLLSKQEISLKKHKKFTLHWLNIQFIGFQISLLSYPIALDVHIERIIYLILTNLQKQVIFKKIFLLYQNMLFLQWKLVNKIIIFLERKFEHFSFVLLTAIMYQAFHRKWVPQNKPLVQNLITFQ